jgi:hypothetical protein
MDYGDDLIDLHNNDFCNINNHIKLYRVTYNNMSEEEEYDEDEYEKESELIDQMFPNANFTIAIDLHELDDLVTEDQEISIKHTYNCYCYGDRPRETEYYEIKGNQLTNKFILLELIKQGLNLDCNHCFVEGFYKNGNTYEIVAGS